MSESRDFLAFEIQELAKTFNWLTRNNKTEHAPNKPWSTSHIKTEFTANLQYTFQCFLMMKLTQRLLFLRLYKPHIRLSEGSSLRKMTTSSCLR